MILKLLIEFYRWAWNLSPLDTADKMIEPVVAFGAYIDIVVLIGIIGVIISKYTDR